MKIIREYVVTISEDADVAPHETVADIRHALWWAGFGVKKIREAKNESVEATHKGRKAS